MKSIRSDLEFSSQTSTFILKHPIKKHVLSFVSPPGPTPSSGLRPSNPKCLFLFLTYHRKNVDILRYFNVTLPQKTPRVALIDHSHQLHITTLEANHPNLPAHVETFCGHSYLEEL